MKLILSAAIHGEQKRWVLERSPARVGRGATNTICVQHSTVSGEHAEFTLDGSQWSVRDLGSLFGTRVNGHAARAPLSVWAGDRVEVGQVALHVSEPNADDFAGFRDEERRQQRELALAIQIQQELLEAPPVTPGWACHSRVEPGREVGGDFYDLHRRADGELMVLAGDVLVLFSDGIPNAMRGHDDYFGFERLAAFLHEVEGERELSAAGDRIIGRIDAFAGGAQRADDVTLLLLRRE
jgi:hypothetical protein